MERKNIVALFVLLIRHNVPWKGNTPVLISLLENRIPDCQCCKTTLMAADSHLKLRRNKTDPENFSLIFSF